MTTHNTQAPLRTTTRAHARRGAMVAAGLAALIAGAQVASAAPTTITFATYGDANELKPWQQIVATFNQTHPDIKVQIEIYSYINYVSKIETMNAAGSAPDIFQTWAQYKADWANQGLIADVSDLWKSGPLAGANVYPFMKDSASYNGRMYGIPFDYNSDVWYVDTDILTASGLSQPDLNWTTDTFEQMAKKMTRPDKHIFGAHTPVDWGNTPNLAWVINWTGHPWVKDGKALVNDQGTVDMLQWWYNLEYNLNVAPTPAQKSGATMAMNQGWVSSAFSYTATKPEYHWAMMPFPKAPAPQHDFAQGHMFSMSAHTSHAKAAEAFLSWMATPEGQAAIVKYDHREPIYPTPALWNDFFSRLPAQKAAEVQSFLNVLYGQNIAQNFSYPSGWGKLNSVMAKHISNIFNRRQPVKNEMDQAATEMQALLDEAHRS